MAGTKWTVATAVGTILCASALNAALATDVCGQNEEVHYGHLNMTMMAESIGLPKSTSMQVDVPVCCERCAPSTPVPSPTSPPVPKPPKIDFAVVRCNYSDKLVPWIPPLECAMPADMIPSGAQLVEAFIRLSEIVKVNATMINERNFDVTGEYILCVFNSVEPAAWFNASCPNNMQQVWNVTVPAQSRLPVYFESEELIICLQSTPTFMTEAQVLFDAGKDIMIKFATDKQMFAGQFSGARIEKAFACGDVELMVFFTTPA
mmetsp:Transcript_14466/g.38690  ORF Transcript_14466/g.38690 Transcript_14466/m.38690 type:complete len:262 (+) Transcript_14466:673-1458(+)